jgi:hypothetical protein
MGFLDNSGDIILDAVLTDLGRKRLAEGNFSITQFALGDDEINYTLYNKNHPSGSAYYDLEIIQTPVLESFTNNTSTMRSRLITLNNNNFLYLPVIKEYTNQSPFAKHATEKTFLIAVDEKTQVTRQQDLSATAPTGIGKDSGDARVGVLFGFDRHDFGGSIMVHQGIDNSITSGRTLSSQLKEEAYIIQIDGRFGTIISPDGQTLSEENITVDDDGFVFYTVSMTEQDSLVRNIGTNDSNILGSKGTYLQFKIKAAQVLSDNQSYFDRFGFSRTINSVSCKVIDSIIRVTGLKTGYSIDIPVRYVKDVS